MVRTRFAPSPTGSLHVGNARIAVLNWLFARQNDGVFVLRIEDTDVERNVAGAEAQILEDLRWLGLDWDEGPGAGTDAWPGPNAPYRQSERLDLYREYAAWLRAAGLAYACYCTPAELEAQRQAAIAAGAPAQYPGTCRSLTEADIAAHERAGRAPATRFRIPAGEPVEVEDVVRGAVRVDRAEIGDFVLLRSDGRPTYNFAVVVDDALMEITHVIRGSGHLSNTPRQVLLYEAIGHAPPVFVHVPMVLGPDRQKLSKRHGATALAEFRAEGYPPDALVNYLSLLAWSSPSGDEFLTRERLISEISLDRVRAADTVFDPAKLRWLGAKHIERMPLDALVDQVRPFLDLDALGLTEQTLPTAVAAVRTHLSTFGDARQQLAAFPGAGAAPETAPTPIGAGPARAVVESARDRLAALDDWDESGIEGALRQTAKETGSRGPALYAPLRLAVTGEEHGPPLVAVLRVLGRDETLRLLDAALG